MAVYGYVRVSTDEQVAGTSLDEQRRVIAGVAMMKGVEVARVFEEPGVSGSVPLDARPAGGELVRLLKRGDLVIFAKLDRAFRSAADALLRADAWKKQGVKLVIANMGADPVTDNGVSKMFFGMLALMAEFERDCIRERMADGRAAKRAKGGFIGGRAPFGYRIQGEGKAAQLVAVEAEQDAARTVRSLRLRGASLAKIAATVRQEHGLTLSREMVRRIATR